MKKAWHDIATMGVFILGNFLVIVLLPAICRWFDYIPDRGLIWGSRPILTVVLWFAGFILVCVGTLVFARVTGRKQAEGKKDA
ncbi:MAG: hypothetical protein V2A34_16620 [Lentisphaerota bacterium]